MPRGLLSAWIALIFGLSITLVPHLFTREFMDASIARWIGVSLMLYGGVLLVDYYVVRLT